jgi:hypothetical protein
MLFTLIDTEEHIREMAPHRLIVNEKVTLESGEIE